MIKKDADSTHGVVYNKLEMCCVPVLNLLVLLRNVLASRMEKVSQNKEYEEGIISILSVSFLLSLVLIGLFGFHYTYYSEFDVELLLNDLRAEWK